MDTEGRRPEGKRPVILAVDRNQRNQELLDRVLERAGYGTCRAGSLEELDSALSGPAAYALALIDLGGFDRQIWDRCEMLRQKGIPFLLISPRPSDALQREGLMRGARGVLVKPLRMNEFVALLHHLIGA